MIVLKIIIKFLKKHKILFISIVIALAIEIFICNYGFFRTILGGNLDKIVEYNFEENNISISNINARVTNITIKYNNKLTDKVTYNVNYVAEDNSAKISINPKVILKNDKQYINLDTHSSCKTLEINCLTESNLEIENILINHPTINISVLRISIIFFIAISTMLIKKGKLYEIEYNKNSKFHNRFLIMNLAFLCIISFVYVLNQYETTNFFINKNDIDKSDSILMQTEAFMNGQVELLEEPSDALKEMENPYDSEKRDAEGVNYLYDVAYYNGNYYNYFGIAPILTSILPFRIITGGYTHTYIFNMFYIFVAVFALFFLYRKIINKYFTKVTLLNFYLGFFAILFASNIFTLLRGQKYDIVTASGIAFILISLNLAMSIYNGSKHKVLKMIALGITTGLIVLSKPNFIVYYLLILIFIFISFNKMSIKEKIKNIFPILIPLGILAIFQMLLNYIRFDNIFEFGAKYQLTGFNMTTCMSFTFGKAYAGIFEYIFRTPSINPLKFPFVFINNDTRLTAMNEICYENRLIGLIGIPILYGYFLKRRAIKKEDNKELKLIVDTIILTSISSLIISTCYGGICEAYSIDFKLILALGAIIILLKWIEKNNKKEDANLIFAILCITTIIIMIPISFTTEKEFLTNLASDVTVYLKCIFEFWS